MDKITTTLENYENTIGIFLDCRKAFDTVNHAILLKKLYKYGIRGIAFDLFKNYLEGRKQQVRINGVFSEENDFVCGVPQGSTLGPLLFLLYINDLPNAADDVTSIMFADDTSIFLCGNDLNCMVANMNQALDNIHLWLCANKVALNVDKTKAMLFTHQQRTNMNHPVCIDGQVISFVKDIIFLGVALDEKLTWKQHIDSTSKKVSRTIGLLYKAKAVLDKDTLLLLYQTLLYPLLSYCNIVYGKAAETHLNRLHILQKKCVRIICKLPFREHTKEFFAMLGLLNIYQIHDYLVAIFVYKCLKGAIPVDLFPYFRLKEATNRRHDSNVLIVPRFFKEIKRKHVSYYGTQVWNNIVTSGVSIDSPLKQFCNDIKTLIFIQD